MQQDHTFEYIIAGGGMAGLSLAFYLNESSLKNERVLIIDKERKVANDHTWCFWESRDSVFEEIVFHRWKNLWFHGNAEFSRLLDIAPFEYKMIRAIDFYGFINAKIKNNDSFETLNADVQIVGDGKVQTSKGEFEARRFVFDSTSISSFDDPGYHNLRQHFLGWTIETAVPCFEPDEATLFDFRIEQNGDCRFIYVLPFSNTGALVEYTLFSKNLLKRAEYEKVLKSYMLVAVGDVEFEITETEFGVIPMSDEPQTIRPSEKTIRIGASGGFIKPSTGYSFDRTQSRLSALVDSLESGEIDAAVDKVSSSGWKRFLDSVLLDVLENDRHSAADVFTQLFRNNPPDRILRFLNEETSFIEDLRIMSSVPLIPFTGSALHEIFKKVAR
jgi:lycopene beta-cyclase